MKAIVTWNVLAVRLPARFDPYYPLDELKVGD
jgi:hypothetical protein